MRMALRGSWLNRWSPAAGTVWKGLRGVALTEQVYQGAGFGSSISGVIPSVLSPPLALVVTDMRLLHKSNKMFSFVSCLSVLSQQ